MRQLLIAALAVGVALLSACRGGTHHESYPSPEQPDPAIALGIETALEALPGVQSVAIVNEVECIDGCKGTRPNYAATVTVTDSASGTQIAAIVAAHHEAYVAADLFSEEEKLTIERTGDATLEVSAPATAISAEMADGFVLTADAGYQVRVEVSMVVKMSVKLEQAESCTGIDASVEGAHAVLAQASATAGIPFATLSARCGSWGAMTLPVVAGSAFVPGWGAALQTIDELSLATDRPDGTIQDFYISPDRNGIVFVYVEVNSGFELSDAELDVLDTLVTDIETLGAPGAELEINQF